MRCFCPPGLRIPPKTPVPFRRFYFFVLRKTRNHLVFVPRSVVVFICAVFSLVDRVAVFSGGVCSSDGCKKSIRRFVRRLLRTGRQAMPDIILPAGQEGRCEIGIPGNDCFSVALAMRARMGVDVHLVGAEYGERGPGGQMG